MGIVYFWQTAIMANKYPLCFCLSRVAYQRRRQRQLIRVTMQLVTLVIKLPLISARLAVTSQLQDITTLSK